VVVASSVAAIASAAIPFGTHVTNAATVSTCLPLDSGALVLRSYLRELVSTTSADRVALRAQLGLIAMDSSRVVIQTDGRVCGRVADAINKAQRTPQLERHLYVFTIGPSYAAQDPEHASGEWRPTVIVDAKYEVTGVVLAP
jgi:hypothetical protein